MCIGCKTNADDAIRLFAQKQRDNAQAKLIAAKKANKKLDEAKQAADAKRATELKQIDAIELCYIYFCLIYFTFDIRI